MKTVKLSVEGMHCQSCVSRVESALAKVDGVDSVEVSLEPGEAKIVTSRDEGSDSFVQAVEEAGYSASLRS